MIISDDVYGTFVNNFKSLMAELPYNTIGAYSYSKYFGVTGWRLGTLALHKKNVFDELINNLPKELKASVNKRYSDMSLNPDSISFMDRVVADSRLVALNHTAGLSTPQQVQMAFFSAFALIDEDNNYKKTNMNICARRKQLLYDGLGLDFRVDENDAAYYVIFDIMEWAMSTYGEDFANFIKENYKPADMLFKLANNYSIVLLSGKGFSGPEWSVRISLANLDDSAYKFIGKSIKEVLSYYVYSWKK
jgi:aspartate 4-decarboxylase